MSEFMSPASDHEVRRSRPFLDIHCHCLPGLDDGPADMEAAVSLCRALVQDRIAAVVATPHQLGRYDACNDAVTIREGVTDLTRVLERAGIPLAVLPGADVRLDERIPQLLESGQILTVADRGRHLMLELPHEIFIDPLPLLARLHEMGVRSVITHPERHAALACNPVRVQQWSEYQPCLQLTAASLLGGFGPRAQNAVWAFIHQSLPVLVATDSHGTGSRGPRMADAYVLLARRLGRSVAHALCIDNPRRLLAGDDLFVVLPGGVSILAQE